MLYKLIMKTVNLWIWHEIGFEIGWVTPLPRRASVHSPIYEIYDVFKINSDMRSFLFHRDPFRV